MQPDPTAGEVGGIFAGLVGLAVALGHGLRWWLGWTDRRAANRAAKLDAWHKELDERERRFDERQDEYQRRIEGELATMRAATSALFSGYQLLATALRVKDPENPALRQADDFLRTAFPLEVAMPPAFADVARKLDGID